MTRYIRYASSVAAVFAFVVAAGWAAAAQTGGQVAISLQGSSQKSDQPIRIKSTSLDVRDKDHVAFFIGNVHVVQGDTTMTCKTLKVFYDENSSANAAPTKGQQAPGNHQIKRLEAKGDVVITENDQTVAGDSAIFEMETNTVTLIGHVSRSNTKCACVHSGGVTLNMDGRLFSARESSTQ